MQPALCCKFTHRSIMELRHDLYACDSDSCKLCISNKSKGPIGSWRVKLQELRGPSWRGLTTSSFKSRCSDLELHPRGVGGREGEGAGQHAHDNAQQKGHSSLPKPRHLAFLQPAPHCQCNCQQDTLQYAQSCP